MLRLLLFFLSLVVVKRHERRATADLRCDGDIEGDRHRASRRRLAAAVLDDPEGRRPGRRPGDLQVARLHGDFPRRGLPGLLRPLQVRAVCLISRRVPADEARTLLPHVVEIGVRTYGLVSYLYMLSVRHVVPGWGFSWISCRTLPSWGSWAGRPS